MKVLSAVVFAMSHAVTRTVDGLCDHHSPPNLSLVRTMSRVVTRVARYDENRSHRATAPLDSTCSNARSSAFRRRGPCWSDTVGTIVDFSRPWGTFKWCFRSPAMVRFSSNQIPRACKPHTHISSCHASTGSKSYNIVSMYIYQAWAPPSTKYSCPVQ